MASAAVNSHVGGNTPTVTVMGEAIVRAEPDEAVLWVSLSALEQAPGPAVADVTGRSSALVALLDELGVDHADRSTTGITVYEEFEHIASGRRSLGHRAVSRVSVRVADPDLIGQLIAQATESFAARIDGPRWLISLTNPVRLEAAREAAADSRRKAQAYAEGVGAKLGRLVRLAEADQHHAIARSGGLKPMAAEAMPIEPGEHEVTAAVHATFVLDPD